MINLFDLIKKFRQDKMITSCDFTLNFLRYFDSHITLGILKVEKIIHTLEDLAMATAQVKL